MSPNWHLEIFFCDATTFMKIHQLVFDDMFLIWMFLPLRLSKMNSSDAGNSQFDNVFAISWIYIKFNASNAKNCLSLKLGLFF